MKNMGEAIMGTGTATGEERAVLAAQQAISSPLLDDASIKGAQGVLVNITGGNDLTLHEVDEATSIIFEEAGPSANIIFGAVIDPELNDEIRVTVIATGFNKSEPIGEIIENQETMTTRSHKTHILSEQVNAPLYAKTSDEEPQESVTQPEEKKSPIMFDSTKPTPIVYGDDLDVPAFIRRQHE